jgi:hypothetical protein
LAITLIRYRYPQMTSSPENGVPASIIQDVSATIRRRILDVSPDEEQRAMGVLKRFFDDWNRNRPNDYGGFNVSPTVTPMMWPAGKELRPGLDVKMGIRATPTSMRNVDADCEAGPIQHYVTGTNA